MKETYSRTEWIDGQTKLTSDKLNNIEKGIEALFENAISVSEIHGADGIKVDIIDDKEILIHTSKGYYMTANEVKLAILQAQLTNEAGEIIFDVSSLATIDHTHEIQDIEDLESTLEELKEKYEGLNEGLEFTKNYGYSKSEVDDIKESLENIDEDLLKKITDLGTRLDSEIIPEISTKADKFDTYESCVIDSKLDDIKSLLNDAQNNDNTQFNEINSKLNNIDQKTEESINSLRDDFQAEIQNKADKESIDESLSTIEEKLTTTNTDLTNLIESVASKSEEETKTLSDSIKSLSSEFNDYKESSEKVLEDLKEDVSSNLDTRLTEVEETVRTNIEDINETLSTKADSSEVESSISNLQSEINNTSSSLNEFSTTTTNTLQTISTNLINAQESIDELKNLDHSEYAKAADLDKLRETVSGLSIQSGGSTGDGNLDLKNELDWILGKDTAAATYLTKEAAEKTYLTRTEGETLKESTESLNNITSSLAEDLSSKVDAEFVEDTLRDYYEKSEVDQLITTKGDEILSSLEGESGSINSKLEELTSGKANKEEVYTKAEIELKLSEKSNISSVNELKSELEQEITRAKESEESITAGIDLKLSEKANISLVEDLKSELDKETKRAKEVEDTKADIEDVYTKTEVDEKLEGFVENSILNQLREDLVKETERAKEVEDAKADIEDVYTKTEVDEKLEDKVSSEDITGLATKDEVKIGLSGKVNSDDVFTRTEVAELLSEKVDSTTLTEELSEKADKTHSHLLSEITDLPVGHLATEDYVQSEITKAKLDSSNVNLEVFLTKDKADNAYQPIGQYLTAEDIKDKADKSQLFSRNYEDLTNTPDLSVYAKTVTVNGVSNGVDQNGNISLSIPTGLTENEVYVKSEIDSKLGEVTSAQENFVTTEDLNEKGYLVLNDISQKADKSEIPDITGLISETEADRRFQEKGDYLTEDDLDKKANLEHTHYSSEISDLDVKLSPYARKSDVQPKGDYATISDLNSGLESKADEIHYHTISDITDLSTTLGQYSKISDADKKYQAKGSYVTVSELDNKGYLTEQSIVDKVDRDELDDYSRTDHKHSVSDITDLEIKVKDVKVGNTSIVNSSTGVAIIDLSGYVSGDSLSEQLSVLEGKDSELEGLIGGLKVTVNDNLATAKSYADSVASGAMKWKGVKATKADLPTNPVVGDFWTVTEENNSEYAWDGTEWRNIGADVDFSEILSKIDILETTITTKATSSELQEEITRAEGEEGKLGKALSDLTIEVSEKATIDALSEETRRAIEEENKKANIEDVYTIQKVNELLGEKINSAEVYTISDINGFLEDKADKTDIPDITDLATKVELSTGLNSKADTSSVYDKNYIDEQLALKVDENSLPNFGDFVLSSDLETRLDDKVSSEVLSTLATSEDLVSGLSEKADISEVEKKANANEVYTIEAADEKFLTIADFVDMTEDEILNICK